MGVAIPGRAALRNYWGCSILRGMRTDSLAPFLAALLLFTAPQAAAVAHSHNEAAQPVPSDAELERSGAVVGQVEIENKNIFDLENPQDNNWLFRLADRLHPVTRL